MWPKQPEVLYVLNTIFLDLRYKSVYLYDTGLYLSTLPCQAGPVSKSSLAKPLSPSPPWPAHLSPLACWPWPLPGNSLPPGGSCQDRLTPYPSSLSPDLSLYQTIPLLPLPGAGSSATQSELVRSDCSPLDLQVASLPDQLLPHVRVVPVLGEANWQHLLHLANVL